MLGKGRGAAAGPVCAKAAAASCRSHQSCATGHGAAHRAVGLAVAAVAASAAGASEVLASAGQTAVVVVVQTHP